MILDVHIMVTNPIDYIERMADANVDYLSFHIDSTSFPIRTLEKIHACGMKAGVVVNPSQDVQMIAQYIDLLDMVTLMAVEPGFAGQKFMMRTVKRVETLARLRKSQSNEFLINIDGAITPEGVTACVHRGANVIVTGAFTVFHQPDGIVSACHRFTQQCKDVAEAGFWEDAY